MYHDESKRAADETAHEPAECEECRRLRGRMMDAERSYNSYRPFIGGQKPRSRWPKSYREESRRLEMAKNLARAEYEFHRGTKHKDVAYSGENNLRKNLEIIARRGRLGP